MFVPNLLKHVWKKVYFTIDLPPNRDNPCKLKLSSALLEFFLPTTKQKKSVRAWLGINNTVYASETVKKSPIPKATLVIVLDIVLFIPRLAANILKLITEVLPLSLRELAYAGFESMLKGVHETEGLQKKLYQAAALICWFFTSLFSFVYFIGCLLTSPGRTIPAIVETFNKLGWPMLGTVLAVACSALVVCSHAALLMTGLWFAFPSVALTILNSGGIGALAASLLMLFDGFGGLIFNTNPNQPNLTVVFAEEEEHNDPHYNDNGVPKVLELDPNSIMSSTNISIPPDAFRKIFNENYKPVKVDAGNAYSSQYVALK